MKARLYRGPFAGKVMKHDGSNMIVVTGPKPMSRKERYKAESDWYASAHHYLPFEMPRVRAIYKICIGPYTRQPMSHPDGSIFYEFVSKEEYSAYTKPYDI